MSRQNTSRTMFGLIMLTVTLLLAACGSGDGDATPTPTSEANAAVPTLPVDDATAETEVISEQDLTVVTPDLPATVAVTETVATAAVGTPMGTLSAGSTPAGVTTTPIAATATVAIAVDALPSTPPVEAEVGASTPAASVTTTQVGTPNAEVESPTVAASTPGVATPAAAAGGSFDTPGDGTGGSGQPGERSSNVPGEGAPSASPVALLTVEGCDVPEVPAFTGSTTAYVTNAEVNFRSGPGTDCTPILEDPLAEGVAVIVLGGPVTQDADNSNWLQVEIDGVPGWVSLEFVESAE